MPLTRRGLLSSTAALAGSRLLPSVPIAAVAGLAPIPAHAWALEALSVVSTVAGMIGAHNRRGGAMISAMNEKLDLVVGQVASLQHSVGVVLDRLAALPDRIDDLLKENETRTARIAIKAALGRYEDQIHSVRSNYASLEAYRQDPRAMADLQAVLNDFYNAWGTLKAQKAYDPYTALLVPSAIALEHSMLLLRGDGTGVIADRLQKNLEWFDKVAEPAVPTSAAAYRLGAATRLQGLAEQASATHFGRTLGMKPGTALYDCVGVNDYRAGTPSRTRPIRGFSSDMWHEMPGLPPRHGPSERMVANVSLEERPVVVPARAIGEERDATADFTRPVLTRLPSSGVLQAADPQVSALAARVQTVDEPDGNKRAAIMRDMIERSPKAVDFQALELLLPEIARERARISFATASMLVMSEARPRLEAVIRDLRA